MNVDNLPRTGMDDFLRAYAGRTVHLIQNPGNAGDSVIGSAGFQFLDRAGIRVVEPNWKRFDPSGKTIFYPGGGNLIHQGTHSHRLLSAWHARAREVVILPHTVTGVDSLLASFGPNVTVICREPVSYAYVRSSPGRHTTLLADDLAFGLDVERLLSVRRRFMPARACAHFAWNKAVGREAHIGFGQARRSWGGEAVLRRLVASAAARGGRLQSYRTDGESRGGALPEGNVDLSSVLALGTVPRALCDWTSELFVRALKAFDEVETDRLHVAITAAVLGKRVRLKPNNYYKIRAIHDFSMRGRFPNVEWAG